MSFAERFEDLRIWQEAREQVAAMYRLFDRGSVASSDFAFRDQLQRAALSVMNNIAEGFERRTPKDFAHFLDQAKGSCGEVRSMLYIAEDLRCLPEKTVVLLRGKAATLSGGIAGLTNHLRS